MKILSAVIIALALGYFFGSCNFSIIFVKIMTGKDIREMGSNNAGLTNTLRCAGKTCALLTLVGDVLKSVLAVYLAYWLCNMLRPDGNNQFIGYIAGLGAVLGHIFPVYYKFKGGKGVLAGASAFLVIDPKIFIAIIAIFIVILYIARYVSLASLFGAAYCPIAVFLMSLIVDGYSFGQSFLYFILSIPMVALIIWKHKPNIDRLIDGTESRFSFNAEKLIKKS